MYLRPRRFLAKPRHADYYFGVSRDEAARSGLERHEATDSFLPFAGIQAQYAITDRLSAVVALRGELLTGSVKDSPMAGRSYTASGAAGLQFTF
ncbi:MAG: MipA/OmpV family protein [Candidatus Adiutrix sp.]|nr:MipA/OmpV family protein [Candidatus Adiutrix sp.]